MIVMEFVVQCVLVARNHLIYKSGRTSPLNYSTEYMKRGETLGSVLQVGNVILFELGKVGEEVINILRVLRTRWRLDGIQELVIHENTERS